MALIVPQCGERRLLQRALLGASANPGTLYIGLFSGSGLTITDITTLANVLDYEVRSGSLAGDARNEPTGENTYARQAIANGDWTIPITGEGIATAVEKLFTLNGGSSGYPVHGYFIFESSDGGVTPLNLLWAEKFPSAYVINSALSGGGQIGITARIELD